MSHGRIARKHRTPSRRDSQLLYHPIRKPRYVLSLEKDDGHFDLSEVVTPLVKFQLPKVAKRPRSDDPDGRLAELVAPKGPSDTCV